MGSGDKKIGLIGLLAGLAFPLMVGAECREDAVQLRNAEGGIAQFSVEIADDPGERAKGLMFRETMPRSAGMLFRYESPQHAAFWMKNTLIPLDMLFANAQGVITAVHSNAIPQDETSIDGGEGVVFVLEINGGLAKPLGLLPGTVLRHPQIEQVGAAWPCSVE